MLWVSLPFWLMHGWIKIAPDKERPSLLFIQLLGFITSAYFYIDAIYFHADLESRLILILLPLYHLIIVIIMVALRIILFTINAALFRRQAMLKIGHRGAPRAFPENTVASFQKAMELGAHGVELDVHLSKDGEVIVIHDETVDRTTDGRGKVVDMTLAELRALSIKGGGMIPTLVEVVEALGKDIYYFIEIKPVEALDAVTRIMQDYEAKGWRNLILISFQYDELKITPAITFGATFEKMSVGDIKHAKAKGAKIVLPNHKTLIQEQVDEAHKMGLQVVVWTVNESKDIDRMKRIGVDGIMTDDLSLLC